MKRAALRTLTKVGPGEPLVVISADDVKQMLNEYRNGLGFVVVHLEACHVVYELLYPAVLDGDADVVIDSIGRAHDVRRFVEELSSRGFEVHLLAVVCDPAQRPVALVPMGGVNRRDQRCG